MFLMKQRSEKLYWEKECINTEEQKKKSKNKNALQEKMSKKLAKREGKKKGCHIRDTKKVNKIKRKY